MEVSGVVYAMISPSGGFFIVQKESKKQK